MRILVIHNSYKIPGGEDTVVQEEVDLLRKHGHEVIEYRRSNREIDDMTLLDYLSLPKRAIWPGRQLYPLDRLLHNAHADVVHIHNTFVVVSPLAHHLCKQHGLPVVQTLHNYRLLCPRADFFRVNRVCEDCVGRTPPWPGVFHRCYHHSFVQSAVVSGVLTTHRWLKTWEKKVDLFIALTEFAKRKFIEGGLPADKMVLKPNFVVPDPGPADDPGRSEYALYVGRFSPPKKMETLLRAWQQVEGIRLQVIGTDDSSGRVSSIFSGMNPMPNIEWLGPKPREEVLQSMKGAKFLVFPSEWYETFGMAIVEAFACGVPVIASRIGSVAEIVSDGSTGLLFTSGDHMDLAEKIRWASLHRAEMSEMGRNARKEYEAKYTAESNYGQLMSIYERAIQVNAASHS